MVKTKCRRWLAAILATALFAGTLSACGKAEQENADSKSESSDKSTAGAEGGSDGDQPRGRYVESVETLPGELEGWNIDQIFTSGEQLHLLATKQENGKTLLSEWALQEGSYTDVTKGWMASMDLPAAEWIELELVEDKDGSQYLYAGYSEEGEAAFRGHLWKGEGDAAREITPQKWTVPNEEYGGYEMVQGIEVLDNQTLVTVSYTGLDILSAEDGSVLESEQISSFYEGGIVTDGENVYLRSSDGMSGQIEKRKEGRSADALTIPYPAGGGDDGSVTVGGTGSLALDILQDGSLIGASEDGIFRLAGGNPEGEWEKLVDGVETNFAMSDFWCLSFAALEDGSIYALFQSEGGQQLCRYVYDPEAVSQVTRELKLFTVYENSLLKQAATMYHKEHPDTLITIEYEYPQYYYDTPDYDAVYQKLNTMLMGDNAPDLVVMDHLNMDSYADKGLLADLEDVVKPMEESGEVLSNITGAYVREDGKRYVVPLQFSFYMAMGRDITVQEMSSMEKLAAFLSGADSSYMGERTVTELVDEFYPYFCSEIVDGKQLDREAMGRYLEYLKAIADNCGIIDSRPEEELAFGMWELAAEAKLAFNRVNGFIDCMFPMSMVNYIKGSYTAFENQFEPSMQIGICSKTGELEAAKDFLRFALSSQVQSTESYSGFPVNEAALETLAAKDRSDYSAATMIKADSGSYIEFSSEAYDQKTAQDLAALCRSLDRPVKEDAKIREVLIDSLGGYLDGSQSEEDTIQKIEDGLKMYLAE